MSFNVPFPSINVVNAQFIPTQSIKSNNKADESVKRLILAKSASLNINAVYCRVKTKVRIVIINNVFAAAKVPRFSCFKSQNRQKDEISRIKHTVDYLYIYE